jgi:hypothetical protein
MTKLQLVLCFAAVTGMIVISVVPHLQAQAPAGEDSKIQQDYAIIATSGITLTCKARTEHWSAWEVMS